MILAVCIFLGIVLTFLVKFLGLNETSENLDEEDDK